MLGTLQTAYYYTDPPPTPEQNGQVDCLPAVVYLKPAPLSVGKAILPNLLPGKGIDVLRKSIRTMSLGVGPYKVFYRKQYLWSCCQWCRSRTGQEGVRCSNCLVVAYCSPEHLTEDLEAHGEICSALTAVASRLGVSSVFQKAYLLGADAFREFRAGLMKMCSQLLGRALQPWEQELCLYPPLCVTCHRLDEGLEGCGECGEALWCSEGHRPRSHGKVCGQLILFNQLLRTQLRTVQVPAMSDSPPGSMEELATAVSDPVQYALLTEVASSPLTILQAVKDKALDEQLVIHIVGAELFEVSNLRKWDDFLFRYLKVGLSLVFIGPEVGSLPDRRLVSGSTTLHLSFSNCLYHEYQGARPHLVCLFNPGLYRRTGFGGEDTWKETIRRLGELPAEVLVTAYTRREITADLARLGAEAKSLGISQSPCRNPCASLRPLHNFVSDEATPLIHKNAFLMVLKPVSSAPNILDSP